jgi:S-adenosylmethionine synthetase
VVLSGGVAELAFGIKKINKPITAYLFGKAVTSFNGKEIPIEKLFKKTCEKILKDVFQNDEVLKHVRYVVDINDGIGFDHEKSFYFPKKKKDLITLESYKSNDTVMCSGYAPYSVAEKVTIDIENFINSKKFKKIFGFTGFDVKVMVVRSGNTFDITLCVPFIASQTTSFEFYKKEKIHIVEEVSQFLNKYKDLKSAAIKIHLNTKDFGKRGYLVAFGSALDKGDFGAVGRGNKYSGIIAMNRKTNVEAVAGKNPLNHSGKLYTIFAHHIAWKLYKLLKINITVDIVARNGEEISKPSIVCVNMDLSNVSNEKRTNIVRMIKADLKNIKKLTNIIIHQDTIRQHVNRQFIYD